MNILNCIWENLPELGVKIIEQLHIVTSAVGIALLIGIPFGLIAARRPLLRRWIIGAANVLQTIPGLALLVFLLPFFGIGAKPAIITLAIYAILPIATNTVLGITQVTQANLEAADALGLTSWQRLWLVELPLARPTMIAGIRIATTISMGMATLAAFIGAGGLGDFINRGLALNDTGLLLLGAIPAAILALLLDSLIHRIEVRMQTYRGTQKSQSYVLVGLLALFLVFPLMVTSGRLIVANHHGPVIRIGSGNFTEQILLSELMAQLIEKHTTLKVQRKFNLGAAAILIDAIRHDEIDLYAAYTGTAYINTLHQSYTDMSRNKLYQFVKNEYQNRFHITWLAPMGFNDTQAVVVREDFAKRYHLHTMSDLVALAPRLVIGTHSDFIRRYDGLPGLEKKYGMHFKAIKELEPTLMYEAIRRKDVDVILAFSTDGRIPVYHLVVLEDDKKLFPPYDGAPIIRSAVLQAYPELAPALEKLAQMLSDQTIQQLNYQVDLKKRSPARVAREFLRSKQLV
ncbi:MAG: hypothetical protein A3E83_05410 [Gammaproteobacteria bacterium RIFCSPHIGHO2_12_FULL_41_20]|nr:MAG: hypothetical protein A3E83_05410 [Gammaproteobacteria bacterium RIFCSPHIGHO2_12_FULL_41_20]